MATESYNQNIRLGLCGLFVEEPIQFQFESVVSLKKKKKSERLKIISKNIVHNANALDQTVDYCKKHNIGSFRVCSKVWPYKAHKEFGYDLKDLPDYLEIVQKFANIKDRAKQTGLRFTTHPDQFVILNTTTKDVLRHSVMDLEYHAELCDMIGGDIINIHAGRKFGDKQQSLVNLKDQIKKLSPRVLSKLTLENDDKTYTPEDLIPICNELKIPFCYDVHHHRCAKDQMTVQQATEASLKTWGDKEPVFHISSPLQYWDGKIHQMHHDYIDPNDLPREWLNFDFNYTLEVEARGKELAVLQLQKDLKVDLAKIVPEYEETTILDWKRMEYMRLEKEYLREMKERQEQQQIDEKYRDLGSDDDDVHVIRPRKRNRVINYKESDADEESHSEQEQEQQEGMKPHYQELQSNQQSKQLSLHQQSDNPYYSEIPEQQPYLQKKSFVEQLQKSRKEQGFDNKRCCEDYSSDEMNRNSEDFEPSHDNSEESSFNKNLQKQLDKKQGVQRGRRGRPNKYIQQAPLKKTDFSSDDELQAKQELGKKKIKTTVDEGGDRDDADG